MNLPIISVIMSVYNEPLDWVQESIDSILQQTFGNFEFIIINDNPNNKELFDFLTANKIKDNRIIIINNDENIGLTKSLNKGLERAKGEYIARMDADDISLPERFEKQINLLNTNHIIGICGTGIKTFGRVENIILNPETMDDMCLFLDSPFAHPTVMFRKKILKGHGYDEAFKVSQDYALWARLYKEGNQFYNLQEVLLHYRNSEIQISSHRKALQQNVAKSIRRDLLSYELNKRKLDSINFNQFSWNELYYLKNKFNLNNSNYSKFIYYLYLSIDKSIINKIYNLICSGDITILSLKNILRIIYYPIKGLDLSKF